MPLDSTGKHLSFRYDGRSMWPLFQPGDLLFVERVLPNQLRPGDCIVYQKGKEKESIVHRVVSVKFKIRTRGDARPIEDNEPILPEWITGRVVTRIRFGRPAKIHGGAIGIWQGTLFHYAGRLDPNRKSRGGKIARICQRLLGPIFIPWLRWGKVTTFHAPDGISIYFVFCKHPIAKYKEKGQTWNIIWPYSLMFNAEFFSSLQLS
jgi:signal peptidase I